ncbi:unnamed protein product, partial [Didymodactylos carnosus]
IILYEFLIGIPPFTGNTPDDLFANVINGQIEWPDILDENSDSSSTNNTSEMLCIDAKNLIECLLEHDPSQRLGKNSTLAIIYVFVKVQYLLGTLGPYEVKSHTFFTCINWDTLLREKADFVPVLESPDDTSYFDTREDRYEHNLSNTDNDDDDLDATQATKATTLTTVDNEAQTSKHGGGSLLSGGETTDSESLFASFSSCSLRYMSELSVSQNFNTIVPQQHHNLSHPKNQLVKQDYSTTSDISSTDVSRTNSCSECFNGDSDTQQIISQYQQSDSIGEFLPIQSTIPAQFQQQHRVLCLAQSLPTQLTISKDNDNIKDLKSPIIKQFGSDTFEPTNGVPTDGNSEQEQPILDKLLCDLSNNVNSHRKDSLNSQSSVSSSLSSSPNCPSLTTSSNNTSSTTSSKKKSKTTAKDITGKDGKKQRKISIKLSEHDDKSQHHLCRDYDDSEDDQTKPRHHHHHHRKPQRRLSPLQPKLSSVLPTPSVSVSVTSPLANLTSFDVTASNQSNSINSAASNTKITASLSPSSTSKLSELTTASNTNRQLLLLPQVSISIKSGVNQEQQNAAMIKPETNLTEQQNFKKSASSHALVSKQQNQVVTTVQQIKPVNTQTTPNKYSQQNNVKKFPRSLSKSFSSSSSNSSPPPSQQSHSWMSHQDYGIKGLTIQQRHNTVSPLERDILSTSPLRDVLFMKHNQHQLTSITQSPLQSITQNLRPPIIIRRGPRSFGFTLRAVKVFHGNTDYYTTQHVVVAVEGPAEEAGLRPNDVITHVNERPVAGLLHPDVVKLILNGSPKLSIRAIPCSETKIRSGGRRRSPSKQKMRHNDCHHNPANSHNQKNKKTQTRHHDISKSSSIRNPGSGSGKKHAQNNSLFRRLSERKVARDIEAAINQQNQMTTPPPIIPTTSASTTTTSPLSSSLPLLLFASSSITTTNDTCTNEGRSLSSLSSPLDKHHQHLSILDSNEWPPLQSITASYTTQKSKKFNPEQYLSSLSSNDNENHDGSLLSCLFPATRQTMPMQTRNPQQISVSPLARCQPQQQSCDTTNSITRSYQSSSEHVLHPPPFYYHAPSHLSHKQLCKTLSEPPRISSHYRPTNHETITTTTVTPTTTTLSMFRPRPSIKLHQIKTIRNETLSSKTLKSSSNNNNRLNLPTFTYQKPSSSSLQPPFILSDTVNIIKRHSFNLATSDFIDLPKSKPILLEELENIQKHSRSSSTSSSSSSSTLKRETSPTNDFNQLQQQQNYFRCRKTKFFPRK